MPLDAIRDLDAIAYVPCLNLRHGRRRSGRLISSCPVSAPRGSSRSFLFCALFAENEARADRAAGPRLFASSGTSRSACPPACSCRLRRMPLTSSVRNERRDGVVREDEIYDLRCISTA